MFILRKRSGRFNAYYKRTAATSGTTSGLGCKRHRHHRVVIAQPARATWGSTEYSERFPRRAGSDADYRIVAAVGRADSGGRYTSAGLDWTAHCHADHATLVAVRDAR